MITQSLVNRKNLLQILRKCA